MAGGEVLCSFYFNGHVSGGRLGRDHKPEDVPTHFVRDCLMDYINFELPEDKRDGARKSVFSDLTNEEIAEYSSIISKKKQQRMAEEEKERQAEVAEAEKRDRWREHVLKTKPPAEARSMIRQDDALEMINDRVDVSPVDDFLPYHVYPRPFAASVIRPGWDPLPEEENTKPEPFQMNRDCDQVRAMIKQLTRADGWTIDHFRRTLGTVSRPDMTKFLNRRGRMDGRRSSVFELSLAFFKRREQLGLPVTGPVDNRHLQQLSHGELLEVESPNGCVAPERLQDEGRGEAATVISVPQQVLGDGSRNIASGTGRVLRERSQNKRSIPGGGQVSQSRKRNKLG